MSALSARPSSTMGENAPAVPDGTTAFVYCEGNFGELDGKTANGLVRHSEKYEVLGVIDSRTAGRDAGEVLDGTPNRIPVYRDVAHAISAGGRIPDYFIFGMAPASGLLSPNERAVVAPATWYGRPSPPS